ncbi:MAG: NAD(P)-dependent oxidoreductase [Dysosmobacter sp.]|nr:NAD(P)-dependent oxidoreductase [Dysosmobacter sp.]
MKRLFIISGVTGMTGSELARAAIAAGDTVVGFDNFFASSIETVSGLLGCPVFKFFQYDLNDPAQMEKIKRLVLQWKDAADQVIYINCAAVVHTEYFYHVEDTFQTNVLGMRSFLAQAVEVGAASFINCSTSEVYSMESYRPGGVREDDYIHLATAEHSQRTSYAAGKLLTEFFLLDAVAQGAIQGCSIRFANVYSSYERYAKHIIPHIVSSLLQHGEVTLLNNAKTTRRTFLHNIDSCSAVLALAQTDSALDGSVYNVATQEEVTILKLVDMIARKLQIDKPVIRFSGERTADPVRRVLSTQKLQSRTGWEPKVCLEDGLDMVVDAYKSRSVAQ